MDRKGNHSPPADLAGREVLVCVCGGIAAYKTCHVVSNLVQRGAGVTVAMTTSAMRFVGPLTFQSLSGRDVITSTFQSAESQSAEAQDAQHIRVTESADLVLIAPATANIIGKLAGGIADDVVTTLVISAASPVVLAPAMNSRMWANPIVAGNVAKLQGHGYTMIGPDEGWLACRSVGPGRMSEPEEIIKTVVTMLNAEKPQCHPSTPPVRS